MVEVAHIVFGRILGATRIQQLPERVLHRKRIRSPPHDVVLVEDVAEEVPVVETRDHGVRQRGGQRLHPVAVVAAQGDIQRDDVLDGVAMHFAIPHGGAGDGETVQERLAALVGIAGEECPFAAGEEAVEEIARGICVLRRHLEQQVVFVARAEITQARRQVVGQPPGHRLQHAVGQAAQAPPLAPAVDAALQGERRRHAVGAEAVDQQEGVLAVAVADIEGVAMQVFAGDRQPLEGGQQVASHGRQVVRIVAADVEHGGFVLLERIQPYREHGQPPRASRRLVQARRIGVVARRRRRIDLAYVGRVAAVGGRAGGIAGDVRRRVVARLQPRQDLLRRVAQGDAEMIDQPQHAVVAHLRV